MQFGIYGAFEYFDLVKIFRVDDSWYGLIVLCVKNILDRIIVVILGMLVYFLYGIHHSKEGENISTYSMLMTSSEAVKGKWGATTKSNIKAALTHRKSTNDERNAIIDEEEIVQ